MLFMTAYRSLGGHPFQRMRTARANNIRPMLPATIIRSALFLFEGLSDDEVPEAEAVLDEDVVEDVFVEDWVILKSWESLRMPFRSSGTIRTR